MFDWVQYYFPSRLYFEHDSAHKIGSMVRDIGSRVVLVTVRDENVNPDQLAVIKTSLEKYTKGCIIYDDFADIPTNEEIDTAAHFTKQCNADAVLAFGSIKSMNVARAIALLSTNETFAANLNKENLPLKKDPLPVISVPAYPALGEECTQTFRVFDPETRSAYFVSDPRLFPQMIFLDPNISSIISDEDMAACGGAALCACVETIMSRKSNEFTNSIALRGMELIARNLVNLLNEPNNQAARLSVCLGSVFSGMAHSNSLLGPACSMSIAASNLYNLDINRTFSILLPHVMEYNLTTSAGKYVQIARAMEEDITDITVIEAAIKAVEGVRKLCLELKLPQRLSDFDIQKSELPAIADQAMNIPLSVNNPRELDKNEIETLLIAAY